MAYTISSLTANVLIQGDSIARISGSPIAVNKSGATQIIDGKGKFLMPGLIDAHWHTHDVRCACYACCLQPMLGYLNLVAAHEAGKTLLRGFTLCAGSGRAKLWIETSHRSGVDTWAARFTPVAP